MSIVYEIAQRLKGVQHPEWKSVHVEYSPGEVTIIFKHISGEGEGEPNNLRFWYRGEYVSIHCYSGFVLHWNIIDEIRTWTYEYLVRARILELLCFTSLSIDTIRQFKEFL